jgi:hypothetical protein
MPTIATLICYDVPRIDRIAGTPCVVVPCPFCRVVHRLPPDTTEFVKADCQPRDYWSLIHGGPALREVVLALETGGELKHELLEQIQPRELWRDFQTIPGDPTKEPNPFAGNLEAQRKMGASFEQSVKNMPPWLDKKLGLKKDGGEE